MPTVIDLDILKDVQELKKDFFESEIVSDKVYYINSNRELDSIENIKGITTKELFERIVGK